MTRSLIVFTLACLLFSPATALAADAVPVTRAIFFPTDPALTFTDNYGDPRSGHPHIGIDILGPKMTPLYAAVDGVVSYLVIPEASWGYHIALQDADGWTYHYIHVNNDTPGTDDGNGGTAYAYAPGIWQGATVKKGQLVGWMGDSGNAENIASHLHFEMHRPDDSPVDPYPSLIAARPTGTVATSTTGTYSVSEAKAASPNISVDKGLVAASTTNCTPGSLIKSASLTAVYYCGLDGKRYVFPNDRVYFSWYPDFKNVTKLSDPELAKIKLGGLVTYRPGMKLVKFQTLSNVYAVDKGGTLRWVQSGTVAASMYGAFWTKNVDDISDAFFGRYPTGEPVTAAK